MEGIKSITDEIEHELTVKGDACISADSSRFGGSSIYFDGARDYLESSVSDGWALGTGDFALELWVNFSSAPSSAGVHLAGPRTQGVSTQWCLLYEGKRINFFVNGKPNVGVPWLPTTDQWYHIAGVHASGTTHFFIDGQLQKTGSSTANVPSIRALTIGAANNPSLFLHGCVGEVRVSKGIAKGTVGEGLAEKVGAGG